MDDLTFDAIAKTVFTDRSRRGALRLLVGSVFTGLLDSIGSGEALLAKGHRRKHKKKKKKGCSPLQTKCGNRCCPYGTFCCGGACWLQGDVQCCDDYHVVPVDHQCCPLPNLFGCALGDTCCGDGCCFPGQYCCGDGSSHCCPHGSTCCGESCCPQTQSICNNGECRVPCGGSTCPPDEVCCRVGQDHCVSTCPQGWEFDPETCLCQECPPGQSLCGGECCDDPCGCDAGVCTNNWFVCGTGCCYQGYTCCPDVPFCCSPSKPVCSGTGGCKYS